MNPNVSIPLEPKSSSGKIPSTFLPRRLPAAFLVLGVALCGTLLAPAQTLQPWTPFDDIENGYQQSMSADGTGNVYVAGQVIEGGVTYGCLTKSSNQGKETTVNQAVTYYSAVATAKVETASTGDQAATTAHHLVTVGQVYSSGEWVVSRSTDAGTSWETLDVFKHPSWVSTRPGMPGIMGAAIDSTGDVYIIAYAQKRGFDNSSIHYWLVRKIGKDATGGSEAGKVTMDLFETANGGYSWPHGITCVGTNVFIAGRSGDRWQVRKNTGGGSTSWELVDDFRYSSNYPSGAQAITADGSGNLYVVGMGQRAVGRKGAAASYWIVRKGTGVGTGSFQTANLFELELNRSAQANGVSVDGLGNVHVTGFAQSTVGRSSPRHWITRRLSATTGNWDTTDHYFLKADRTAAGWNIAADFAGNVFAAGTANDGISEHDWVVRRLLAP